MTLAMNKTVQYEFRLFVAGDTSNSLQAIANLRDLCNTYLPDRHTIEIVDVFREPSRALADSVFMTPTLIKLGPLPSRRIVGTLSLLGVLLQSLDLADSAA
ncbi:MAG: circadian clock KaiB family protein [Pseudomonadota bacterium]|nr:circadian clock KaiB family protein [Pseudomonadota bacterium]